MRIAGMGRSNPMIGNETAEHGHPARCGTDNAAHLQDRRCSIRRRAVLSSLRGGPCPFPQPAAINHPGGSNVLHVGAFGDMLQPGNGVVGDIHLAKPSFELLRPRGVPVTEGFAFGQVGKAFVAFDIGILLGGDRDLAELIPRNALGGQRVSNHEFRHSDLLLIRNFHFACPATGEYTPECPARHLIRIRSNGEDLVVPTGPLPRLKSNARLADLVPAPSHECLVQLLAVAAEANRACISRVKCGTIPSTRSITMSCPLWCISCSFTERIISKRLFDAGFAPSGICTCSLRKPSLIPCSHPAHFSPSPRSSSRISSLLRGFFSSAIMRPIKEGKSNPCSVALRSTACT